MPVQDGAAARHLKHRVSPAVDDLIACNADAAPVRRLVEIEEISNLYIIHPLANRLAHRLRDLRVSANAVSLAGMSFGILAAGAYFQYQDARYCVAGFILMIAWHVMDGTDGQLARLTCSQSDTGKVLDGICDYVTFIAVYTSFALSLAPHYGAGVWALVIVAGLCHVAQAATYEMQRQEYEDWGFGRRGDSLPILPVAGRPVRPALLEHHLSGGLRSLYAGMQFAVVGYASAFRDRLDERFKTYPNEIAAIRARYRQMFAQPVRTWSLMSANYRTLAIFAFALAKSPLCYFIFEIVVLSAVHIVLIRRQQARYTAFLQGLGSPVPMHAPPLTLVDEMTG